MDTSTRRKFFSKATLVNYFPKYALKDKGVIHIEERPPALRCFLMGFQHILTMFGGTVIGPLLMGLDTNTALFFSGIGTIIFYVITGGRVPSFVGPSFAFIGAVGSATGYKPDSGHNEHIDVAAGGILVCGVVYCVVGIIVMFVGYNWIEVVMPPGNTMAFMCSANFTAFTIVVVTGTVVTAVGLHLSYSAFENATRTEFDGWMAFTTVLLVSLVSIYAPGEFKRFNILIGMVVSYVITVIIGCTDYGRTIDYTKVNEAAWFSPPNFVRPKFEAQAISIIAPVCLVLVAENLGHLKAVGAMVGKSLDKYLGRAFVGDAVATIVSASGGGPGTTTYAENIGVMVVTQNFSTLVFLVAAVIATFLGFVQKIGAVIQTLPQGVFGGLSIILFGLIAVSGVRIWVENEVDFKDSKNMLVAGIPVIIGAAMQTTLKWGNFQLDGIGLPTYSAIILYQILRGADNIPNFCICKKKNKIAPKSEQHPVV